MKKLFVIAGFARCGTTWLHNRLVKHSKIQPALGHVKEIGYFEHAHRAELNQMSGAHAWGDRVDRANQVRFPMLMRRYGKLQAKAEAAQSEQAARLRAEMHGIITFIDEFGRDDQWYRELFSVDEDDWAIDSTPAYSRLPDSGIAHIGRSAEQVKVALIMREPAARLRSLIQHNARQQSNRLSGSSEKIVRLISRRENPYINRVEAFKRNLRADQLSIFFFEDLIRERGFSTRALLDGLGLEPEPEVFEEESAPNASDELLFDGAALRALADHGERVTAEIKGYIGSVPPEWDAAAVKFRTQAEAAPAQSGLSKKVPEVPANISDLSAEIERLQRGNRTGAVLDLLSRYLSIRGDDAHVRMLRAQALERMGRFDQALKDFSKALAAGADPDRCRAAPDRIALLRSVIDRAKAQIASRDATQAIDTLNTIDEAEGLSLKFLFLAKAQLAIGDRTQAKMSISRFLCEQPGHEAGEAVRRQAFG